MSVTAAIYGIEGTELQPDERAFFREADPWGFILFARNLEGPKQISRLTMSLRDCVGRDAPILIDQEGGRVARLRPPTYRAARPAQDFGDLFLKEPEAERENLKNSQAMA